MFEVIAAVAGMGVICLCSYFVGFARGYRRGYLRGWHFAPIQATQALNESTAQVLLMRHLGGEQKRKYLPS